MIEKIQAVPNRKVTDLKEIQAAKRPVVMYGAGSYAVDVTTFLAKYGVQIDAYCIDGAYLKSGQLFLGAFPVLSVEEAFRKYPERSVIIGFNDSKKARETLAVQGNDAPTYFFDAPNHLDFFDYEYIKQNQTEFDATYNLLSDQRSKDIFVAFINAKISGDPSGLHSFAQFDQYFNDIVILSDQETFVDCGAYDGDTIAGFLRATGGQYCKVFAFEPDKKNYRKLQAYIEHKQLKNIVTIQAGSWSEKSVLNFSSEGNMAAIVREGGDFSITVDAIDNVVKDDHVTYIKMDIEGAELEALKGARQTIQRDNPKLAICAYHKPEDLITLPQFIQSLNPDYRFYLRHHQLISWEMVLYAIPG